MVAPLYRCCTLLVLLNVALWLWSTPLAFSDEKPFFDANQHRVEYVGPGRESEAPTEIDEVRIGFFGPFDPADPSSDLWRAAQRAIDEANQQGGFRGTKPFRLIPAWSDSPWANGVKDLARIAYRQRVWAIVGGVDGPSAHLAEQIVAKARIPLINAVSTDKTVNLANVPWVFSMAPGDHHLAPMLARAIVQNAPSRFVLASADDHDSREFTRELTKALGLLRAQPKNRYTFRGDNEDFGRLVREATRDDPSSVVIVASADASARLVVALRRDEYRGPLFGGPAFGRRHFWRAAGSHADGSVYPRLTQLRPTRATVAHGPSDDYATLLVYDSVSLLVEAIRSSGLNRARIRDTIAQLSPWEGKAGDVRWDGLGRNSRTASLGIITHSRPGPRNPSFVLP